MKTVVHHITLNSIGGIQSSYVNYYKYAKKKSAFKLLTFSNFKLEKKFYNIDNFFYLGWNVINWLKFISYLKSQNVIKIFHGSFGSKKLSFLFKIIKPKNCIFYEHGGIWNLNKFQIPNVNYQSNLSNLIIANSKATKTLLTKKFKIKKKKICVINYGYAIIKKIKKIKNKVFTLGFIGRFDAHKGAHIFLETAKILEKKNYIFKIAGDGQLKYLLYNKYKNLKNVVFCGRIKYPLNFINKLDCLIIPSIREPLGLVAVEAGLVKTAVIATKIDGLPEAISKNCGFLIKPTKKLNSYYFANSKISKPTKVVSTNENRLIEPKEINPKLLAKYIQLYSKNRQLLKRHSDCLNVHVKKNFSINKMFLNLEKIYKKFL